MPDLMNNWSAEVQKDLSQVNVAALGTVSLVRETFL